MGARCRAHDWSRSPERPRVDRGREQRSPDRGGSCKEHRRDFHGRGTVGGVAFASRIDGHSRITDSNKGGTTLISDQFNHRVVEVDRAGNIVKTFGNLNSAGYGPSNTQQGLNGPYDAKVVGDFTGLTPPR